jgi:DNA-binding CsgD family transcriptional regulator/tetratricopeptide (TPR) repeat protein
MGLLERESQLTALDSLLGDAEAGAGRLVFIAGEAGAGKSALVQRFSDLAASRARVMRGCCDPLSTPRPLGPLADIAASLGGPVPELLRSGARHSIFEATVASLGGDHAPTVVVVEDAQWADEGTLDLIRFLGRRLSNIRALVIVTYRDDEVPSTHQLRIALGDLASSPALRRLDVPALTETAVELLCAGGPIDAGALYRRTGGNAFFVTEVLASGAASVPPGVTDAVLARTARLSPAAQRTLQAAAVIGARIEPSLLLQIEGIDALGVDECVIAGMLRFTPPVFVFRHELARQAILAAVPAHHARDLHAHVLCALRGGPRGPDALPRLSEHAEQAGDPAGVLEYAPAAADAAARLKSHREAERQLARALRFAQSAPLDVRADLYERHAYECYLIDHLDEAVVSCGEAIGIWRLLDRPLRLGDCLRRLSRIQWVCGDNAAAERAGREAIEVLEQLEPGPELAMAWSNQSQLGMLAQDVERATTWGERAMALARELGDTRTLVNALNNVGAARMRSGDDAGEPLLRESLRLARDVGLEDDVTRALTNLSACYADELRFTEARQVIAEAITYCAEHDLWSAGLCARSDELRYMYSEGRWEEAVAAATSLLQERRLSRISRIAGLVVLGLAAARRGQADVWSHLDAALEFALPTNELQWLGLATAARAEAWWLAGRMDEIARETRPVLARAVAAGDSWRIGELAFWLWRAGRITAAPDGALEPFAKQISGDWGGAAAAWRDLGFPYETASALLDGDETAVREALVMFTRLGAKPAIAMASRRLRILGARSIPRGPRRSTGEDADGLTVREREVLGLLAESLTNGEIASRLFLSEKTVEHHVSAILAKLGVSTRVQAAKARRDTHLAVTG